MKTLNLLMLSLVSLALFSSCDSEKQARIDFISKDSILPEGSSIFWGDTMTGDSVFFSSYKYLPKITNNSDVKIDTFYLDVQFHGISDVKEISKYYVVDSIIQEKGSDFLTAYAHYGKFTLLPHEEVPFPVTQISSHNQNRVLMVRYTYFASNIGNLKEIHSRSMICYILHEKSEKGSIIKKDNQRTFIALSRTLLPWKNLGKNTWIYKDTIVPEIKNYDLLKGKELKINKISELQ